MSKKYHTIGINREYNYHPAFHGEIFKILKEKFILRDFPLVNFSEYLIRSQKGSWFSKQVFSFGKFKGKADFWFSPHILLLNKSDWVIDLEHPFWLFTDHYANVDLDSISFKLRIWVAKKWLECDNCKSIIAWSRASQKAVVNFLGEKIAEKVSIIYPMVSPPAEVDKRSKYRVSLLFIMPNKDFEQERKGKDVVLNIFRKLRNNLKVKLIFVGYLTNSEKMEFGYQIEHYPHVDREILLSEIYPRSDILLFPSRADTFGAVIIEAQSRGVVPIASCGKSVFSTPELIKNGENGFLIRNIDTGANELDFGEINKGEFLKLVNLLVENNDLRTKLSFRCKERFLKSNHNPYNQKKKLISLFLNFMTIR